MHVHNWGNLNAGVGVAVGSAGEPGQPAPTVATSGVCSPRRSRGHKAGTNQGNHNRGRCNVSGGIGACGRAGWEMAR